MKQYETPKFIVSLFVQDVVTSSNPLDAYDDTGSWGGSGWSNGTGGNK